MKVILFLGSGVSLQSGLPAVGELTSSLFRKTYHQDEHSHFSSGRHPEPEERASDAAPRVRKLLQLLRAHDERDIKLVGYSPGIGKSSGAIFRGDKTTYEDLFFICNQISLWNIGLVDNSFVTPLMEVIERKAGGLLAGRSRMGRLSELGTLASTACTYIESVVAEELRPKGIEGFDLILELATAPFINQLIIVTLNHDTLVEQFLVQNNVEFIDWFGENDGDVRWYDESAYDEGHTKVRILKLHGSIDWYSFRGDGRPRRAIFLGNDVKDIRDGEGTQLTLQQKRPSFLSGINKAAVYQRGIYSDMHFRFHQLLRESRKMVMSGYGWGDIAINFRLETWLDQNRNNSIILLHEKPEDLKDRSLILANAYDAWTRSGQLNPIKKWLSETTLQDLCLDVEM